MKKVNTKQAVQNVAQSIFDKFGEVSPSQLVAAAKPKNSPAHSAFEWDDTKAGEEYRLIQARQWLRVIVVTSEPESPEKFVHVASGAKGEGSYKPASIIVKNVDEFARALDEATQRLTAARNAVEELRRVAERSDSPDRIAMVVQVSRALDLMQQAIQTVH